MLMVIQLQIHRLPRMLANMVCSHVSDKNTIQHYDATAALVSYRALNLACTSQPFMTDICAMRTAVLLLT